MGVPVVFDNQMFDHWLSQKSQEILHKVDKEKLSTEDLMVLSLKALTNHYHHLDVEVRGEFQRIDKHFEQIDKKFDMVDRKFDMIDKKFDRLYTALMWGFGLVLTSIFGLYIKFFIN